jgi:hypothetical protein
MKRLLWMILSGMTVSPAWAQSPYVAGAVGAEIVRATSVTGSGAPYSPGSGESWSAAIRAGTQITPQVGVELEWLRPGEIEDSGSGPVYIATELQRPVPSDLVPPGLILDASIFPIISQQTRLRTSTLGALVFVRQSAGARVDLVYLGGIGFSRVVHEIEYGVPRPLPAALSIVPPYRTRTTQYGAGPVVGAEGRIQMTGHARLIVGMRLHALGQSLIDGWVVRPNLGLAWIF